MGRRLALATTSRTELTDRGHHVFTPTLTGLGERAHLTSPAVNLSMHGLDIANVIKYERLEDILLVGHSYGGMPISVATELVPEGIIRSIMYLDAFFPEDGECLNDLVPGKPHLPADPEDYLVPPPRKTAGDSTPISTPKRARPTRRCVHRNPSIASPIRQN